MKLLLSTAVLAAASSAAFGQDSFRWSLSPSNPTFNRPIEFTPPEECTLAPPNTDGSSVIYSAFSIPHDGGILQINLDDANGDENSIDFFLGLYDGMFDPADGCKNAIAYNDNGGGNLNAELRLTLPKGFYTILATTYSNNEAGAFTITHRSIEAPINPASVPVAGIPALALGSIGLIGAAGFVSRRRKAKAEKA